MTRIGTVLLALTSAACVAPAPQPEHESISSEIAPQQTATTTPFEATRTNAPTTIEARRVGGEPLIVTLPEAVTGAWTLRTPQGSCRLLLTQGGDVRQESGCGARALDRWTLDGADLLLWRGSVEIARFRASLPPPLQAEANGEVVTLVR